MIETNPPPWLCPVCAHPLILGNGSFSCASGHLFDLAREGYVNLLLANQKHSANPGDDRMMSRCRRQFLEQGYYDALADLVGSCCRSYLTANPAESVQLLDIGCGEGYYTQHIYTCLTDTTTGTMLAGIDISKEAIRMAARRYPDLPFAVASNSRLPVADGSIDIIYAIFAPSYVPEIVRALKPGGIFLNVRPESRHLFALRQLVYDDAHPHQSRAVLLDGLSHQQETRLSYPITVRQEDISNLLAMTPYYWQASREKQQQIADLAELVTEVDFIVDRYALAQ
jgi:23S rRNA (guanine745-N1)-methyltransferase